MTTDWKQAFLSTFDDFKHHPLFARMNAVTENSPWHRESSVGVHTQMVVDQYIRLTDAATSFAWTRDDYLAGIAAAFHDTGKPPAEIKKWSQDRGNYNAYHGHELLSARLFETYAVENTAFSGRDIAQVSFIIEHHMPWSVEDAEKRRNLALTAIQYGGADLFCRHLLADQYGRIADDQENKNKRADEWVQSFLELAGTQVYPTRIIPHNAPVMYIPVGPSGCGKSTFLKTLRKTTDVDVFSLDALRHEWYDQVNYTSAYQQSVDDKSFEAKANARFHEQVKTHRTMYIDNTNLSARRRKMYLSAARLHGFKTIAIIMPISLSTLIQRRTSRSDKTVPESAVIQHYNALQAPLFGEFDDVVVSEHNMHRL